MSNDVMPNVRMPNDTMPNHCMQNASKSKDSKLNDSSKVGKGGWFKLGTMVVSSVHAHALTQLSLPTPFLT